MTEAQRRAREYYETQTAQGMRVTGQDLADVMQKSRSWGSQTLRAIKATPAKADGRKERTKRHGLSKEAWEYLFLSQGNVCAACGCDEPSGLGWATDHDHRHCPGQQGCRVCVRGILCGTCNTGMGLLGDSPASLRKAADYLEEAQKGVYQRMVQAAEEYRESWVAS